MLLSSYLSLETDLHRAVQFITLIANSSVESKSDDSHTTTAWVPESKSLVGKDFTQGETTYSARLHLPTLTLSLHNHQQKTSHLQVSLIGTTVAEAKDATKRMIKEIHPTAIFKDLHYDLPEGFFDDHHRFTAPNPETLAVWMQLRTQANKVFDLLNKVVPASSAINIWPHHFDTGVYYPLQEKDGETIFSIGAGMAIADSLSEVPYYYVYGWSKEDSITYDNLPALAHGKWIVEGDWKGALLPVSPSGIPSNDIVNDFLKTAATYYLS